MGADEVVADDGPRGFHRSGRPVPGGAARSLLPDAGLGRRRRGPGAGDVPAGVAGLWRVRGPFVGADLAVPDRDQRMPDRDRAARPPAAAVGAGEVGDLLGTTPPAVTRGGP